MSGCTLIIEAANVDLRAAKDKNKALLEAKLRELDIAREEARKDKQLLMEEEETARLRYEDTYGRLLRIEQACTESLARNTELKSLK